MKIHAIGTLISLVIFIIVIIKRRSMYPLIFSCHNMMDKANSRLYILRTCKYYGHTLEELTILFHVLISGSKSQRSINSASEHGNMATPTSAYSSAM